MGHPHAVVTASRGGITESSHTADVVVSTPDGHLVTLAGDADHVIYPRSALKPFQAMTALAMLAEVGMAPTLTQLAIGCASHCGGDDHQVEAASLLAEADLDEAALRCPPDWPIDEAVRGALRGPTTLAHNCSGKHALLLWAHTATGGAPQDYLVDAAG